MSKITTYLNEHLTGEIVNNGPELSRASIDGSILTYRPEMVAHVANTSDIRKIARFCWQLAEKGHVLPITARGHGTDMTGAAIGSGIIISQNKYMNRVIGIDTKQRLMHVQAGAPYVGVNMTLSTHRGLTLPYESFDNTTGSVGGAIATGAVGQMSARYGAVADAVQQVEMVLANGDVLQTGRLSKRELNAKKGLHTMEGEVYRQIDNLITDNRDLIQSLAKSTNYDTAGYFGITKVKRKDGSLDLTPLLVGSQGTLGIITEVILKAQFSRKDLTAVVASYADILDAQAAADQAVASKAVAVELFDGRMLKKAVSEGKKREYIDEKAYKGALVVAIFDEFNSRLRNRSAKKLHQSLTKANNTVHLSVKDYSVTELADLRSLLSVATQASEPNILTPSILRGIRIPVDQFSNFYNQLSKMETKHKLQLPVYVDYKSGLLDVLPFFDIKKVSERQKLIVILTEIAAIVSKLHGSMSGYGGDGRIKSAVTAKVADKEVLELYAEIKKIFDPHNLLNPGVKQQIPAKELVLKLNEWCRLVATK